MEKRIQHILVVDDDRDLCALLTEYLSKYQFRVSIAKDGNEMYKSLERNNIDLILLDMILPGTDGLSLCQQVREKSDIPIIILTANDDATDRIVGLELGADDYQAKPYNPRELVARIRAVLKRYNCNISTFSIQEQTVIFNFGDWTLNTATRKVTSSNKAANLTSGEYEMLLIFLERPQRVLSRDQLLNLIHNRNSEPFDRSIDVQISRLRQKLEATPKNPIIIKTIRGGGYILSIPVQKIGID